MTYNDIIQKAGKRILKHIYYIDNGITTNVADNNVEIVKFNTQTPLIGTSITGCEITLKEKIQGDIYAQIEASYGNETATQTYGPFNLKEEPQYNASEKTYLHKTYDNILKSMVDYKPITMNYPCTIYQFFSRLTTELGYTNNIASLPNGTLQMASDIYDGIGFTYRDVLDDIAYANGVLFYVDGNEIKTASLGGNSITIDDDILKNKNIDFKEHYGPINSIVLSRTSDTDTIASMDDQSIAENGLCEFKIKDNQLMNGNNRSDFLPALLQRLDGIEFDIYDVEITGWGTLIPLQSIVFNTGGNTYNTYAFNNERTLTSGYKQALYVDKPEQTQSDYKYMTDTDKTLWEAGIIIDKKIGEVDIRGKTINLTADDIAISSTNFSVTKDGNLTCNNATINGTLEKTVSGAGTVKIGKSSGRLIEFNYTDTSNNQYYDYFEPEGFDFTKNNQHIAELFRSRFILYDNNTQKIYLSGSTGEGTFSGKITAGNIDCGTASCSSDGFVQVNFNKTFANVPRVVATPNTNTNGVIAAKIKNVSTTGFQISIGGSQFASTYVDFDWIAIGN